MSDKAQQEAALEEAGSKPLKWYREEIVFWAAFTVAMFGSALLLALAAIATSPRPVIGIFEPLLSGCFLFGLFMLAKRCIQYFDRQEELNS